MLCLVFCLGRTERHLINMFAVSDINECDEPNICQENAICENTSPGHTCTCSPGFQAENGQCIGNIMILNRISGLYVYTCVNVMVACGTHSLYIYCPLIDVDECENGLATCSPQAQCENNDGSYTCSCNDGFSGDGQQCDGKLLLQLLLF